MEPDVTTSSFMRDGRVQKGAVMMKTKTSVMRMQKGGHKARDVESL